MRNGASDQLFRSAYLSADAIFSLLSQQIMEELYPLIGEEGIDTAIEDEIAALEQARDLYPDTETMLASDNERVVQIAHAIQSGDSSGLAL